MHPADFYVVGLLFSRDDRFACRPFGIIFLSAHRLIGTDADIVLFLCRKLGDLPGCRLVADKRDGLCALELAVRGVLELIAGGLGGLFFPSGGEALGGCRHARERRSLRNDRKVRAHRAFILGSPEPDGYLVLTDNLASACIRNGIPGGGNRLACRICYLERRLFRLAVIHVARFGQCDFLRTADGRSFFRVTAFTDIPDFPVCVPIGFAAGTLLIVVSPSGIHDDGLGIHLIAEGTMERLLSVLRAGLYTVNRVGCLPGVRLFGNMYFIGIPTGRAVEKLEACIVAAGFLGILQHTRMLMLGNRCSHCSACIAVNIRDDVDVIGTSGCHLRSAHNSRFGKLVVCSIGYRFSCAVTNENKRVVFNNIFNFYFVIVGDGRCKLVIILVAAIKCVRLLHI